MSASRRYRAPTTDGSILAEPPFPAIGEQLRSNRARLDQASAHIDGTPLPLFRQQARVEILAVARQYLRDSGDPLPDYPDGPLLMSGHQPELTHVGVLVKTFALCGLARRHGLTPLNLIVDNDTVKNTALRFAVLPPRENAQQTWNPDDIHVQSLPYDRYEGEVTFEQRRILEPELFHSFPERAAAITSRWRYEPILPRFWEEMERHYRRTPILGEVIAATRRTWERRWGCHNLEIPLSRLCTTNAFRRFTKHLCADLPRFHQIYNECLAEYRRRNHVRSRNHPAPDLARDGDYLEAPFWRMGQGTMRRSRIMLRASEVAEGADLRSRALTTTMFLRIVLADGFIHGIGGAKYDEVTDSIIERWLGVAPPGFIVITATLRPPMPRFPTTAGDVKTVERLRRDLIWNPQRYLPPTMTAEANDKQLLDEKARLANEPPASKVERKIWFQKLSAITERLRNRVSAETAVVEERLHHLRREMRANEVLMRRDYSWCLFPEDVLRDYCTRIMAAE